MIEPENFEILIMDELINCYGGCPPAHFGFHMEFESKNMCELWNENDED